MDAYSRALIELIRHPGSNITAATIGLAIIVLMVIMLLFAAVAWVLLGQPEDDEELEGEEDDEEGSLVPPKRPRRGLVLPAPVRRGAIGSLLLVAAVGGFVASSANDYCGRSCHSMTRSYDSWKGAAHAKVSCVRCHEGRPVLSAGSGVTSRVRHLVADALGSRVGEVALPASRCLECHADIAEGVMTTQRGIRVSHAEILEAGGTCDSCHRGVAHQRDPALRVAAMDECLRCHDGKSASAVCSTCHEGDVGKATMVERVTFKTQLPKPVCGGCHSEEKCDACHGLRMPHPEGFGKASGHAYGGSFGGRRDCMRCHTNADCNKCHRVGFANPFPHGPDWKSKHALQKVSDGASGCKGCHPGTENLCVDCHPRFGKR